MEQKLNIAEILKNKPRGTKLYSMIHGKCSFEAVTDEIFKINFCTSKFGLTQSGECTLIKFGNMYDGGECIIFPSKKMRDWSKFSWKKGDVLINSSGFKVIFDKWANEDYTKFFGKIKVLGNSHYSYDTAYYTLASKEEAQEFIKSIEKTYGGKLNLETLEIEKQPEFKDGDIVSSEIRFIDSEDVIVETYIVHNDYFHGEKLNYYAGYNGKVSMIDYNSVISPENTSVKNTFLRYATEEEKQQLFDALAKENKVWDAEKKQIVDLKPKCKFKPFDKVLGRNEKDDVWEAELFSHYREESQYPFRCIGFARKYCIPYEGNEYLLGTKNDPK